jgi:hypothetical protein
MALTQPERTIQQIEQLLPQLQSRQLEMVLAFTEFVRSQAVTQDEDEFLWSMVEREQAYRAAHPEDVLVFDSDEELLAALDAIQ